MHHIVEGSLLCVLSNTWQRCEWESSHYSDSSKAPTVAGLPFGLVPIAQCRPHRWDFTVKAISQMIINVLNFYFRHLWISSEICNEMLFEGIFYSRDGPRSVLHSWCSAVLPQPCSVTLNRHCTVYLGGVLNGAVRVRCVLMQWGKGFQTTQLWLLWVL